MKFCPGLSLVLCGFNKRSLSPSLPLASDILGIQTCESIHSLTCCTGPPSPPSPCPLAWLLLSHPSRLGKDSGASGVRLGAAVVSQDLGLPLAPGVSP